MDLDFKKLKKIDPVLPQEELDLTPQEGTSPFSPPNAYSQPVDNGVTVETMHAYLRTFTDEHADYEAQLGRLESLLGTMRQQKAVSPEAFAQLREFFTHFEAEVVAHNRREERELFPVLRKRFVERGERSNGPNPVDPCSVLEAEHVEAVRIGAVAISFFALANRLEQEDSKAMVLSIALERTDAFIKHMRLHIFREDRIVFALAQEYLTTEELDGLLTASRA
jgi:hemerythrin-like domain-containing protein